MRGSESALSDYESVAGDADQFSPENAKDSRHLLAMLLNLLVWLLALVGCVSLITSTMTHSAFFRDDFLTRYGLVAAVVYALYLAETITSKTFQTLFWAKDASRLNTFISFIRESDPRIVLRVRPYSLRDRLDPFFSARMRRKLQNGFWEREFRFEKVLGKPSEFAFAEFSVEDASDGLLDVGRFANYLTVRFQCSIEFGDESVRHAYESWSKARLKEAYGSDSFVDAQEVRFVPGMIRELTVRNLSRRDLLSHWSVFFLASAVLLMSWPFRLYLDDKFSRHSFTIRKVLVPRRHVPRAPLTLATD